MLVSVTPVETREQEMARRAAPWACSPAALSTARVLLRFIRIASKPGFETLNLLPNTRCLAIMIDLSSNVWRVMRLRPELHYWQDRVCAETATGPQLGHFLHRLIEAAESMYFEDGEKAGILFSMRLPHAPKKRQPHVVSGAALRTACVIFDHFDVTWKLAQREGAPPPNKNWIAGLIDTNSSMFKLVRMLPNLRQAKTMLANGQLDIGQITQFFKWVGIQMESVPTYEDTDDEAKVLEATTI